MIWITLWDSLDRNIEQPTYCTSRKRKDIPQQLCPWNFLGLKKGGDDSRGDGNSTFVTGNKDKVSMLADRFL